MEGLAMKKSINEESFENAVYGANSLSYAFQALEDFFNLRWTDTKSISIDDLKQTGCFDQNVISKCSKPCYRNESVKCQKGWC